MSETQENIKENSAINTDSVKLIKNNTSLMITIPVKWREIWDLDAGDLVAIKFLGIVKKVNKEDDARGNKGRMDKKK